MSSGGHLRRPVDSSAYRPEPYRPLDPMTPNVIFYAMGGPIAEPSGSASPATGCAAGASGFPTAFTTATAVVSGIASTRPIEATSVRTIPGHPRARVSAGGRFPG